MLNVNGSGFGSQATVVALKVPDVEPIVSVVVVVVAQVVAVFRRTVTFWPVLIIPDALVNAPPFMLYAPPLPLILIGAMS